MKAPNKLVIKSGRLYMHGMEQASRTYLKQQQENLEWPDGTEVCVIRRVALQKMYDEIEYWRSMMLCA